MALAQGAQHALLMGHARVETADLRITADRIELFGKDLIYAQCSGSVHVVDAKRGLDITSDQLFYDRERKIARVRGSAVMADLENEIVARGGFIEDRDGEKITIFQIGVRIFRRDIECKAEFARYYRDRKVLELSGMPWVAKGSDIYVGTRITINLDTEEISAEGGVSGSTGENSIPEASARGTGGAVDSDGTSSSRPGKSPGGSGRDVTFRMEKGRWWLRPQQGKTTVFYMVVGFIRPTSGRIWLNGRDVSGLPMYRRARIGISYLPQEPSIFRKLSVEDNVAAILETRRTLTRAERTRRLDQLLDDLGIRHREQKAWTLSGGGARRSPGRWPSSRASCSWTNRSPASIPSP
jgi:hypothetical protein